MGCSERGYQEGDTVKPPAKTATMQSFGLPHTRGLDERHAFDLWLRYSMHPNLNAAVHEPIPDFLESALKAAPVGGTWQEARRRWLG